MLIPPLLSLTGLLAIGKLQPVPGLSISANFNVADLALTALSFLGKRGPAGLLLPEVRQHFKDYPEQLRQLALYSLQSGTLITPVVVPLTEDNFQRYSSAIEKWMKLRDSYNVTRITAQNRADCLAIHRELLDCAEEVAYPTTLHILAMLQRAEDHPERWQQTWQSYLLGQLNAGQYIHYQEAALLWAMLFPEQQAQAPLARCILSHYNGNTAPMQKYAQRFIVALSENFRYLRHLRYLGGLCRSITACGAEGCRCAGCVGGM